MDINNMNDLILGTKVHREIDHREIDASVPCHPPADPIHRMLADKPIYTPDPDTTTETIIGQSFQVKWSVQDSKYWASTYLDKDLIYGSGFTKEDALARLVYHIEYLDSGEGEQSHAGWCDLD